MKLIIQDNNNFLLRFDKGEEVIQGIADFMGANSINGCALSGIGTCSEIEIGYFNPNLKEYRRKPYYDSLEIISLTGSGAMLDGKPAIHLHGMFGHTDFTTLGGHLFKIVTLATCEIFLTKFEGIIERKNNPDYNLNLLV